MERRIRMASARRHCLIPSALLLGFAVLTVSPVTALSQSGPGKAKPKSPSTPAQRTTEPEAAKTEDAQGTAQAQGKEAAKNETQELHASVAGLQKRLDEIDQAHRRAFLSNELLLAVSVLVMFSVLILLVLLYRNTPELSAQMRQAIAEEIKKSGLLQLDDKMTNALKVTTEKLMAAVENTRADVLEGLRAFEKGGTTSNGAMLSPAPLEPTDRLCSSYRAAQTNPDHWAEFLGTYQPVRFGCANATERIKNPSIPPKFQIMPSGQYMAVCVAGVENCFAFPWFDLQVDDYTYKAAALAEVFVCRNYTSGRVERQFRVVHVAVVARNGTEWTIRRPGLIELG